MAFAKGKHSKFISDRSGMAFPYTERVKEWNGALVHISEYEPKHPQLEPIRSVSDPMALRDARSDRQEPLDVPVGGGGYPDRGQDLIAVGKISNVEVVTS